MEEYDSSYVDSAKAEAEAAIEEYVDAIDEWVDGEDVEGTEEAVEEMADWIGRPYEISDVEKDDGHMTEFVEMEVMDDENMGTDAVALLTDLTTCCLI